jgi:hypothetical protein
MALSLGQLFKNMFQMTISADLAGDAPFIAAIITIQTLLSFISLPITIILATYYFRWR